MATFADLQAGVAKRIQDAAGKLASTAIDDCIREAITGRYSQARPMLLTADFDGDGVTYKYILTELPGWDESRSGIRQIEYPEGEREPHYLDRDDWIIYRPDYAIQELRLVRITPALGKTMRMTYSVPRAEDGSDVPAADFYGLVNLASSLAATRLAAIYAQISDSALGGDAIDYKSKSDQYRSLARDLWKQFEGAFGLDVETPQPAASSEAQWREDMQAGGRRLIH